MMILTLLLISLFVSIVTLITQDTKEENWNIKVGVIAIIIILILIITTLYVL